MKNVLVIFVSMLLSLSAGFSCTQRGELLYAQGAKMEMNRGKRPEYPRNNGAISYAVDPNWPQRPAHLKWGETPGVAVDAQDNVWVFTRNVPPVQVFDSSGAFLESWGQSEVVNAHFLRIDRRGCIWLTDIGSHVVMQFAPDGRRLMTLGVAGVPGDDDTHFDKPTDVAIAPSGDIFVSDGYGNNRIVHFDSEGRFVKAWGKMGTAPGEFSIPHALVIDSRGRLYVADRNNARVQVFDPDGLFLAEWRNIIIPWGLWIGKEDEIWACGSSPMAWTPGERVNGIPPKDQMIVRFNADGKVLQMWTFPKGADDRQLPGDCNWIHSIALDSKGDVYLSEIRGRRVQKFVRSE